MEKLYIDTLTGENFEEYLLNLFIKLGYDGFTTQASNDYGADLVIIKGGKKTVVQAKRYSTTVGISSVQEVIGAKNYYQATKCLVVTNNYFTPNAIELATHNDVELWDRDKLIRMITISQDKSTNHNGSEQKNILLQDVLNSSEYKNTNSDIPIIIGAELNKNIIVSSMEELHHLLVVGMTGSGKSKFIHSLIVGIINKAPEDKVKLLLIDPKIVELNIYNGIPHLLIPVVTDAKKSPFALNWAVNEMERRYKLFAQNSVRDIISYNSNSVDKLPKIVIIIDELVDLIAVATDEINGYICRLSQMARAAGMYLIITTQIPNILNTFKNNFPSRVSFRVLSQIDSKTIIDSQGAENLINNRELLFYSTNKLRPVGMQSIFISDDDTKDIVKYLSEQNIAQYDDEIIDVIHNPKNINSLDSDELLSEAIGLVVEEGQASISLLQRRLKISYSRAARIIDDMEERGVVGGYEGSKPRKVLFTKEELISLYDTSTDSSVPPNNTVKTLKRKANNYEFKNTKPNINKLNYLNLFNFNINRFIRSRFLRFILFPVTISYYMIKISLFFSINIVIFLINILIK